MKTTAKKMPLLRWLVTCLSLIPLGGAGASADVDELKVRAQQGEPAAQRALAVRYYDGNGVAKDLVEAVKWFRKAAEQGDPNPGSIQFGSPLSFWQRGCSG